MIAPPANAQDSKPVFGVRFKLAEIVAPGVGDGLEVAFGVAVGLAVGFVVGLAVAVGVGVAPLQVHEDTAGHAFRRQTPT
jgi:hypothetical protein